ncbi:hypothetical protein BC829DRAFT_396986 [Chytridium lagenaria]|nr:hypothetical protein BC829DRAFT_396986 [Chytridium lagenaria]
MTEQVYQRWVSDVYALFPAHRRDDILTDLRHTKDVEATINRILDSTFLSGTDRDPSLDLILIDDDDGAEPSFHLSAAPSSRSPQKLLGSSLSPPPRYIHSRTSSNGFSEQDYSQPHNYSSQSSHTTELSKMVQSVNLSLLSSPPNHATRNERRDSLEIIDLSKTPAATFKQAPKPQGRSYAYSFDDDDDDLLPTEQALFAEPCFLPPVRESSTLTYRERDTLQELNTLSNHFSHHSTTLALSDSHILNDSNDEEPNRKKRKRKSPEESAAERLRKEQEAMRKRSEKDEKARQKELEKEEKRLLKEKEMEEKRLAKEKAVEDKRREIEELRSQTQSVKNANKLRDKRSSIQEMIVEVDPAFVTEKYGAAIIHSMQEAGGIVRIKPQPLARSLIWKRKVSREWDNETGRWKPCDEKIATEPFVVVRIDAATLSSILLGSPAEDVLPRGGYGEDIATVDVGTLSPSHIETPLKGCFTQMPTSGPTAGAKSLLDLIGQKYPKCTPILLVEGTRALIKERTRLLDAQLREEMKKGEASNARKPRQNRPGGSAAVHASKEQFEAAYMWFQFQGYCFVHTTESQDELTKILISFAHTISMLPERLRRNEQSFQLNFGDYVKSGKDTQDTWRRILMEVKPCSENAATAITEMYPSFRSLYDKYCSLTSENARELLLENIVVPRLGGAPRRVGPSLSRKIYLTLMSKDENIVVSELGTTTSKTAVKQANQPTSLPQSQPTITEMLARRSSSQGVRSSSPAARGFYAPRTELSGGFFVSDD